LRSSIRLLSLGATAAILLAACTGGGTTTSAAPSVAPTTAASAEPSGSAAASASPSEAINTDWTACVAFDTGGLGDKNFNDLAKKGLDDAKALGYKTFHSEAQGATDYAANIQRLIDEGCQTIVTVGFLQSQATADAAKANPEIAFAQVDTAWNEAGPDFVMGTPDDTPRPPNFTGLDYQIDQASMLAGYLAAGWSKSGKVGTYGGLAFPGVTRFMDGLYAGVQHYNKEKGKTVAVVGWAGSKPDPEEGGTFVGGSGGNDTWNDPGKGEQIARTMLDQGVDVLHPVAGSTGNGSIKAMHAAGKWAIGVDADQWISLGDTEYHKAILTSAQKAIDVSVVDVIKKTSGGDIGGEDYSGTLANNGVLLAPFHDYDSQIPAELKAEIETLRAAIADGSVTVCSFLGRGC
jgi:basic membrane protein A and related proteins